MANEGKKFEGDFEKSIPAEIWHKRLKDDMGKFKGVHNICDFILYNRPHLFLMELKSVQGNTIPLDKFAEHSTVKQGDGTRAKVTTFKRVEELHRASEIDGVIAGYIIEFRKRGLAVYIPADKVFTFLQIGERKSITLDWALQNGFAVKRWLVRTRYGYDIPYFLTRMVKYNAEQQVEANSLSDSAGGSTSD